MPTKFHPYAQQYDLMNCDDEPIQFIRLVQPHACLLAVDMKLDRIVFASENTQQHLGIDFKELLNQPLQVLLGEETIHAIRAAGESQDFHRSNPFRPLFAKGHRVLNMIVHEHEGMRILEFEPRDQYASSTEFIDRVDDATQRIQSADTIEEVFQTVVEQVQQLTGHDRVMLYRFDEEGHGSVVAEEHLSHVSPFLGIHFPNTDIPAQARRLFVKNQTRITVDTQAEQVRLFPILHPETGEALDLTYGVTRGVSPVHIEYLQNMGVRSTLSIAIVLDGELWGLIACHHYQPKFIDFRTRKIIRFFAKIVSGHLSLQAALEFRKSVLRSNRIKTRLFEQMSDDWNIVDGLTAGEQTILDLNESHGAILSFENHTIRLGVTPDDADLEKIMDFLNADPQRPLYKTDSLKREIRGISDPEDHAAGMMAVKIGKNSNEYVLWFKPAQTNTVVWGGKPGHVIEETDAGNKRLTPRKSFAKWQEQVAGISSPWARHEVDTALAIRADIIDFIVQKYDEVRRLNHSLTESYDELETFSYSVSHDLRTPLRSIEGFTQILMEDYGDKLDEDGRQIINTILNSTAKMNNFIKDILSFSRIGRQEMTMARVSLGPIVRSAAEQVQSMEDYRNAAIDLKIQGEFGQVMGEPSMLLQLFENLIGNAVKYSSLRELPVVTVEGQLVEGGQWVEVRVTDNGIGFDMEFADKIFDVFTRLVGENEFQGTGVGLAVSKRVVERHGGKIWANSEPGKGTTFFIQFPLDRGNG